MNKKMVGILFLSLLAFAACSLALPVAVQSVTSSEHFDNRLDSESYFTPCGDPIETPGWPTVT